MPGKLHRMEELSSGEIAALDKNRTVILVPISPLEAHGSHLPVGVDYFNAVYFAEQIGLLIIEKRSNFDALLFPGIPLGTQVYRLPGSIRTDAISIYKIVSNFGKSVALWGFKYVFLLSGHGAPKHIVAVETACIRVSRKYKIQMHNLSGMLAFKFMRGDFIDPISSLLPCPLTVEQKDLLRADLHGGWWETSMMLLLRPDLVKGNYRELPSVKKSERNKSSGAGYYGSPALANREFAEASMRVMAEEGLKMVQRVLDSQGGDKATVSPLYKVLSLRPYFHLYLLTILLVIVVIIGALLAVLL
jgi:creatinine amidohydrolase